MKSVHEGRLQGFTLIELLVVISIIALLIGILLPALGAARQTARGLGGLVNGRSLGQAVWTYCIDNDDYYVQYQTRRFGGWKNVTANDPQSVWWTAQLARTGYAPTPEVFTDPLFEEVDQDTPIIEAQYGTLEEQQEDNWLYPHFSMNTPNIGTIQRSSNFNTSEYAPDAEPPTPKSSQVASPSEMIYFTTAIETQTVGSNNSGRPGGSNSTSTYVYGCLFVWDYANTAYHGQPEARYNGSLPIVYADGHAAWFQLANPEGSVTDVYGAADLESNEYDGYLTDARYHDNNRWTIDGKAHAGVR